MNLNLQTYLSQYAIIFTSFRRVQSFSVYITWHVYQKTVRFGSQRTLNFELDVMNGFTRITPAGRGRVATELENFYLLPFVILDSLEFLLLK